jgi:hypothetical protein
MSFVGRPLYAIGLWRILACVMAGMLTNTLVEFMYQCTITVGTTVMLVAHE